MVPKLVGHSEIGEHVICYLICLRLSIRSRAVTNRVFFHHACATCSELPSDLNTMVCPDQGVFIFLQFYQKFLHKWTPLTRFTFFWYPAYSTCSNPVLPKIFTHWYPIFFLIISMRPLFFQLCYRLVVREVYLAEKIFVLRLP